MKTKSIVFAKKNGQIIDIDDVESGLACNCYCFECGSKLVAHKGEKKQKHFKHYENGEREACFETAIHFASKNLFAENKIVLLPNMMEDIPELGYKKKIFKEIKTSIETIVIEEVINDFKPDILVEINMEINGKNQIIPLIIEIAVTHFVDKKKLLKIEKSGINAIEISLKDVERVTNGIDLWNELINPKNINWLYKSDKELLIKKAIEQKIKNDKKNQAKQARYDKERNDKLAINQKLKKSYEDEGYLLRKIYNGRKENLSTVEDSIFTGTIICPKEEINPKIERAICEKCKFHHDQFKDFNEDNFRIVCGYKNQRLNYSSEEDIDDEKSH